MKVMSLSYVLSFVFIYCFVAAQIFAAAFRFASAVVLVLSLLLLSSMATLEKSCQTWSLKSLSTRRFNSRRELFPDRFLVVHDLLQQ